MKSRTAISILVASILALTSMSSFAGPGQRGDAGANRAQQVDRDRTYDRDRISDRDRMGDRSRAEDPALKRDRDRDQDRTHMPDPSNMKNQDIYGNALMTDAERMQYRQQLGNTDSQESRKQFQSQHEDKMQQRALMQGQDLVPPGQGPIYGGEFMSVQERNEYREQLRLFDSEKESQQFRAQHRDRVNQRAHALGLEVEEAE